jgi:glycosyltransferase involved in cell wall biosynthesis
MKTAILIPCYNEAKTIKNVVNDFKKVIPHADIYVYDNNSTDGTDEIEEEQIFEDMGGKEKPIEKRKKTKGKKIS